MVYITTQTSLSIATDPTNQHASFQRVLSPLARFSRNFSEGHPSQNCSKSITLNCGVFMEWSRHLATRVKLTYPLWGSINRVFHIGIRCTPLFQEILSKHIKTSLTWVLKCFYRYTLSIVNRVWPTFLFSDKNNSRDSFINMNNIKFYFILNLFLVLSTSLVPRETQGSSIRRKGHHSKT